MADILKHIYLWIIQPRRLWFALGMVVLIIFAEAVLGYIFNSLDKKYLINKSDKNDPR